MEIDEGIVIVPIDTDGDDIQARVVVGIIDGGFCGGNTPLSNSSVRALVVVIENTIGAGKECAMMHDTGDSVVRVINRGKSEGFGRACRWIGNGTGNGM